MGRARCPTSQHGVRRRAARVDRTPTRRASARACGGCSSRACSAPRRARILEQLVERARGATPGLVNRIVAGTGDVDSAQPARAAVGAGPPRRRRPGPHGGVRRRARRHRRAHGAARALQAGDRRVPPRPRPPRQRRVRARLARVGDGPDARLRQHRPAPPRRRPTATRTSTAARLRADADGRARRGRAARPAAAAPAGAPGRRPSAGSGGIARERAKDILVLREPGGPAGAARARPPGRRARRARPTCGSAFCVTIDELPALPRGAGATSRRSSPSGPRRSATSTTACRRSGSTARSPIPSTWTLRADAHRDAPGGRDDPHGHRGERRPGVGTRPRDRRPGRPPRPRARRDPRVRHHRPVVDAAVPRAPPRWCATPAPCRATPRSSPASSASPP